MRRPQGSWGGIWGLVLIASVVICAGCSRRYASLGALREEQKQSDLLSGIVVPLAVRSFEVTSADGQRGVFFRLSRVPDEVRHRDETDPPRIIIDVLGPAVGEDVPAEPYPGGDTLVQQILMSRTGGQLQLVVELGTEELPPYSVRQMADWLLVRFNPKR